MCRFFSALVLAAQMVSGVLIMTTYKLLLIPHKLPRRGSNSSAAGPDARFFPFGHLPKEYVQVRERALHCSFALCIALSITFFCIAFCGRSGACPDSGASIVTNPMVWV